MDKTYLRTVFLGAETLYALSHVTSAGAGPDRKTLDAIRVDMGSLSTAAASRLEEVLRHYDFMNNIVKTSYASASSFKQAVNLIPASDWTKRLRAMPVGSVLPNRSIMESYDPGGRRLYDVTEGRFLTQEEAKGVH